MLLSTKLGHHQQYCCKFHCFQQDRAICQHLTIQGKNSTVSLGIKLTQKTLTTPVSIKWLCWNFMCGFLKGKAFKSTCTLWPEKKHYKHSNCNSSLPGDCKTQNREQHCTTTCDCREKKPFQSLLYLTLLHIYKDIYVDCIWNVMAHVQKPDFIFRRNGRVHLNRWGRQFSWLLAAEVCASAVVMLDTPCSEVAWEYWLPTPFASFPFTSPPCVTVCHRVSTGLYQVLM